MSYLPQKTCCPGPVASTAAIPDEANCSWLHHSHHCEEPSGSTCMGMVSVFLLMVLHVTVLGHNDSQFQCPIYEYNKHLTHWGWMVHTVSMKWVTVCSGNDLLPMHGQAITWTYADLLSIATNCDEIWSPRQKTVFKKMCMTIPFSNWWPFCSNSKVWLELLRVSSHKDIVIIFSLSVNQTKKSLETIFRFQPFIWLVVSVINQCWLFIVEVPWHFPESNFTATAKAVNVM